MRLDSRLLFPASRGGPIVLQCWRSRDWNPAVVAAGYARCKCGHLSGDHDRGCQTEGCACRTFVRSQGSPTPYALRHTYASLMIGAGVNLFELSRLMGTSPAMLDQTYGHLLPDTLDRARSALDAFIASDRSGVDAGGR